jgi:hypothetical protein
MGWATGGSASIMHSLLWTCPGGAAYDPENQMQPAGG